MGELERGNKIMMSKKNRERRWKEEKKGGFRCSHCRQWVSTSEFIGTAHRNHCSLCLWSKHVDLEKPGDRKSKCQAGMEPIGLTFKHEGWDKWGEPKQGELMLIHQCTHCEKISINRIAADDNPEAILNVLERSKTLEDETQRRLKEDCVRLLTERDRGEIVTQLFGKNNY